MTTVSYFVQRRSAPEGPQIQTTPSDIRELSDVLARLSKDDDVVFIQFIGGRLPRMAARPTIIQGYAQQGDAPERAP